VDTFGPVPVVKADVETVVPGTVVWLGSVNSVTVVAAVLIGGVTVDTSSEIIWQMFTQSISISMLEL